MTGSPWKNSLADLKRLILAVGLLLFVIYVASGIYSVSRNEYGVLKRFGKIINSTIQPGIHYALPWPIDRIQKVPVREARSLTINAFAASGKIPFFFRQQTGLDTCCITGDNNIVNITFVIQYTFNNPADYLTGTREPEVFLQRTIERTIMQTISELPVDMILTHGKRAIADRVKQKANHLLDKAGSGMRISFSELVSVTPPLSVQASFDDVVNAKIDRERLISESESYRNSILPQAKGSAHEIHEKACAYKERVITEAEGNAQRFNSKLKAYTKARQLIRQRLWLAALQKVMTDVGQIYIMEAHNNKPPVNLKITSKP